MKKFTLFMFIAVLLVGSIYAQNRNTPEPSQRQSEHDLVTLDGTLKLERGFVAIQSDGSDSAVAVPMLNRFIGFINGLQEGATVSVEGFRHRNVIQPTKLTIDGRTYDFPVRKQLQSNAPNSVRPRQLFRDQDHSGPARQHMREYSHPGPNRNPGSNRNHSPNRRNDHCRCCCR